MQKIRKMFALRRCIGLERNPLINKARNSFNASLSFSCVGTISTDNQQMQTRCAPDDYDVGTQKDSISR